jgi:hypothetical protein
MYKNSLCKYTNYVRAYIHTKITTYTHKHTMYTQIYKIKHTTIIQVISIKLKR